MSLFSPTIDELDELIRSYPLALLISRTGEELLSTPLPILIDRSAGADPMLLGRQVGD